MMLAAGGVAAAWMAVPVVDMSVRGTTDQRTVAGWRSVARRVTTPVLTIPVPRLGGTADRIPA
jgi:hypothetical protein